MESKIESIIYKVLDNSATAIEREAMAAWIRISPENEAEFESYKILWAEEIPETPQARLDFAAGRKKLMGTINLLETRKRRTIRVRTAISIALFLVTIFISVWNLFNEMTGISVARRFDNVPIETVIQFLTENSDVKFSFENNGLKSCRFDGYLISGSDADATVIAALIAMKLTYKIEPSGDFLISGNCGN